MDLAQMRIDNHWPANPFWDFSTEFYTREGVAERCIKLQNTVGLDVNILLFCFWAASLSAPELSRNQIKSISDSVSDWNARVVRPLREIRHKIKDDDGFDSDEILKQFGTSVGNLELEAERLEQLRIFESFIFESGFRITGDQIRIRAKNNIRVYLDVCGLRTKPEEDRLIDQLLEHLMGFKTFLID